MTLDSKILETEFKIKEKEFSKNISNYFLGHTYLHSTRNLVHFFTLSIFLLKSNFR